MKIRVTKAAAGFGYEVQSAAGVVVFQGVAATRQAATKAATLWAGILGY